ncbi:MAG: glycosyltransferase family 39 protein [Thermoanaerobaculales bacterium]
MRGDSEAPGIGHYLGFFGALVLGAGLRLHHITFQSLWLDELFSVVFSRSDLPVAEIIRVYQTDVHPVGYPLLLHCWLGFFGDTDSAARSLSAVLGILGIGAMYVVGRWAVSARVGLAAAFLTAVNAFHIFYSQEARSYTLVFVFAAFSYLGLLMLLDKPGPRAVAVWTVAAAAAIHTHYWALVMLAGQLFAAAAILLFQKAPWRRVWPWAAAVGMVALTMVPWLDPLLKTARLTDYWPARPEPFFFVSYFHTYFGREPLLSLLFAALLVALPFLLWREDRCGGGDRRVLAAVLGTAITSSMLLAYLRSVAAVPMLMPRFTFVLLPALFLLFALAIASIPRSAVRWTVVAAILAASLVNLARTGYYTVPRKEQWRDAVKYVLEHPRFEPGSNAFMSPVAPGFQFYFSQLGSGVVVLDTDPQVLEQLRERRPAPSRIWVLRARGEEIDADYAKTLRRYYVRRGNRRFLKTGVERWEAEGRN